MKSNIDDHKLRLALKAQYNLPRLLVGYQPNDFDALGNMCNELNVLVEFVGENLGHGVANVTAELSEYLDDKFKNCVVLVLKDTNGMHYGYTANNVTKFLRGESLHGSSDNRDSKREALHTYVFERNKSVECEFQICWNLIMGPNLRAASGNFDTDNHIVYNVSLNENKIEVGQIESTVINIVFEFWKRSQSDEPFEPNKTFIKFNPFWYESTWGKDLSDRVAKSLTKYYGISLPESD